MASNHCNHLSSELLANSAKPQPPAIYIYMKPEVEGSILSKGQIHWVSFHSAVNEKFKMATLHMWKLKQFMVYLIQYCNMLPVFFCYVITVNSISDTNLECFIMLGFAL